MAQVLNHNSKISSIQKEIELLRSFIIGIAGKDEEGEYKPEFVKRILKAPQEKPKYTFRNKQDFITQLRKN